MESTFNNPVIKIEVDTREVKTFEFYVHAFEISDSQNKVTSEKIKIDIVETKIFHATFFVDGQPDIVNIELYDKNENDYALPEISC